MEIKHSTGYIKVDLESFINTAPIKDFKRLVQNIDELFRNVVDRYPYWCEIEESLVKNINYIKGEKFNALKYRYDNAKYYDRTISEKNKQRIIKEVMNELKKDDKILTKNEKMLKIIKDKKFIYEGLI